VVATIVTEHTHGLEGLDLPKSGAILPKLGMSMETISLANALFSKVQQRVLALIFGHPQRSFYTSEIVRTVRSGTGAVARELARLKGSGIISAERIGNQQHYRANPNSPIFNELKSLVLKTVALAEPLKESLEPIAKTIDTAFIYGSFAKGTDTAASDIDLMVIGDNLDYAGLFSAALDAETKLGRKVSPTLLSRKDWIKKANDPGSFVSKVQKLPKIFVIGSEKNLQT
jgi:predicted nucleotidyltransferase